MTQRTAWCVAILLLMGTAGAAVAQYEDISDLKVKTPEYKQDAKSVPPPEGAIVLFDGKSLDGWVHRDGKTKPVWVLLGTSGGAYGMQVHREGPYKLPSGDLMTKKSFDGAFKLHVEFRVPYMPEAKGEARGNSGV